MLVLTRKPNQQLHIGNDIVITIVKVRGNTIRLGIEAPKDLRVLRAELEPKPTAGKSSAPTSAPVDASAAQGEPQASSGDGSADAAQEAAQEAGEAAAAPVIFEARIRRPARSAAPLKRFAIAARAQGAFAEHNLEDSPLCHHNPQCHLHSQYHHGAQGPDRGPRPACLHSSIASKNGNRPLQESAGCDQPFQGAEAYGKAAPNRRAVSAQA